MAKSKALVKQDDDQELANLSEMSGYDYLEAYAKAGVNRNIVGKLLKFSKGDYMLGQENEEIEEDTEVVACLDTLETGWIKWFDNKPVDAVVGKAFDGFAPPVRSKLGDDDQDAWEEDDNGDKRDPWQFTNAMQMRPLDWDGDDTNLYTFVTQSKGGIDAIKKMMKEAVPEARQREGEYPVITLGVRSYMHPKKEYGRIKTPEFEMTGDWVDKDPVIKVKPKKAPKPAKAAKAEKPVEAPPSPKTHGKRRAA